MSTLEACKLDQVQAWYIYTTSNQFPEQAGLSQVIRSLLQSPLPQSLVIFPFSYEMLQVAKQEQS